MEAIGGLQHNPGIGLALQIMMKFRAHADLNMRRQPGQVGPVVVVISAREIAVAQVDTDDRMDAPISDVTAAERRVFSIYRRYNLTHSWRSRHHRD